MLQKIAGIKKYVASVLVVVLLTVFAIQWFHHHIIHHYQGSYKQYIIKDGGSTCEICAYQILLPTDCQHQEFDLVKMFFPITTIGFFTNTIVIQNIATNYLRGP